MELPTYIEEKGDEFCAELFEASIWTVRAWRRRVRYPRHKKAADIIERTEGVVDYSGIYGAPEAA